MGLTDALDVFGAVMAARGAILLGRLRDVGDGRLILDDTVGRDIRFGDEKSAEFKRLIGR